MKRNSTTWLIGICGMKEQGKSTLAMQLGERYKGMDVIQLHFATPLKEAVSGAFDIAPETSKQQMIDALGITVRQAFQRMGDGMRQAFGEDVFVKLLHSHCTVEQEYENGEPLVIIIDDVRFENEAAWILRQGGHIVHIERSTSLKDNHASEVFAWQFRSHAMTRVTSANNEGRIHFVNNNGTVDDLRSYVSKLVDYIEPRHTAWTPPETVSHETNTLKDIDDELTEEPMHSKPGPYELDIINRNVAPLHDLVKSMTWWPDLGFESMLTTRECGLLHNHLRHNLRMPSIRDIELGFVPLYQQKTPQERVLAALEECIKRQNASAIAG